MSFITWINLDDNTEVPLASRIDEVVLLISKHVNKPVVVLLGVRDTSNEEYNAMTFHDEMCDLRDMIEMDYTHEKFSIIPLKTVSYTRYEIIDLIMSSFSSHYSFFIKENGTVIIYDTTLLFKGGDSLFIKESGQNLKI